jgi:hypothetical protein
MIYSFLERSQNDCQVVRTSGVSILLHIKPSQVLHNVKECMLAWDTAISSHLYVQHWKADSHHKTTTSCPWKLLTRYPPRGPAP